METVNQLVKQSVSRMPERPESPDRAFGHLWPEPNQDPPDREIGRSSGGPKKRIGFGRNPGSPIQVRAGFGRPFRPLLNLIFQLNKFCTWFRPCANMSPVLVAANIFSNIGLRRFVSFKLMLILVSISFNAFLSSLDDRSQENHRVSL